jgi:DNA-binding NtrC family response regulator
MKILVVDDERSFRALLFNLLQFEHDVSVLADGHNALKVLRDEDHDFDVVILDIRMPRVDGEQVIQAIAEQGCTRAKFVVVTGHGNVARLKSLPNVVGVWPKPFSLNEFARWLGEQEKVLSGSGR